MTVTPPPACPHCGGRLLPVVFGMPTPELVDEARAGEFVLGGCCVPDDHLPQWECNRCETRWP
jgi:hypothetical protein